MKKGIIGLLIFGSILLILSSILEAAIVYFIFAKTISYWVIFAIFWISRLFIYCLLKGADQV